MLNVSLVILLKKTQQMIELCFQFDPGDDGGGVWINVEHYE